MILNLSHAIDCEFFKCLVLVWFFFPSFSIINLKANGEGGKKKNVYFDEL